MFFHIIHILKSYSLSKIFPFHCSYDLSFCKERYRYQWRHNVPSSLKWRHVISPLLSNTEYIYSLNILSLSNLPNIKRDNIVQYTLCNFSDWHLLHRYRIITEYTTYCKTLIIRVTLFSRNHLSSFIHETLFSRLVISSSIILTLQIIDEDFIFASLCSREFTRK